MRPFSTITMACTWIKIKNIYMLLGANIVLDHRVIFKTHTDPGDAHSSFCL